MTRIKMIQTVGTSADTFMAGKEYDLIDEIAKEYLAKKLAEQIGIPTKSKDKKPEKLQCS